MGRRAYRGADPFRFSLIFRTSAMTIRQMQIKLSTTLKAEAIEVAHVTVVIFPFVAREIKRRKSKPADLKILDAPGGQRGPYGAQHSVLRRFAISRWPMISRCRSEI